MAALTVQQLPWVHLTMAEVRLFIMWDAIEALGLTLFVKPIARLNSVVGIDVPENIDSKKWLKRMSQRYRVEISGSFGPNIVRIGQMGEQSRAHNLFRTVHALGSSLNALGGSVDVPAGVAALECRLEIC